jgi:hypothetical protein
MTDDSERLYAALRELEAGIGGKRLLSECHGRQCWPKQGVYFFFEPGELRSGGREPRIVRIGTHAVSRGSKTTLWNRLRTHKGTGKGLGNHRGSIFRLHLGAALANRNASLTIHSWGAGSSASASIRKQEEAIEREVSLHIGKMQILWIAVEDKAGAASDRAYLERNLIGLLGARAASIDCPSTDWLGRFSPNERIQESGLWNLNYLDYAYSPDSLDLLEKYVAVAFSTKS